MTNAKMLVTSVVGRTGAAAVQSLQGTHPCCKAFGP